MSCCISSAVCCVLITSSMSGVALGYNYSLAEYIDMKETNVSVYMKRGVFDDDVADDMGWRRSAGHEGVKGFVNDDADLLTAPPEGNQRMPIGSGRRLDDSLVESNDNNKFEGSLIKLTVRPPLPLTTVAPVTEDDRMRAIAMDYPRGSLNQLKAVQNLINMRKAAAMRETTEKGVEKTTFLLQMPQFPSNDPSRRMMGQDMNFPESDPSGINPARFAVPDKNIGSWKRWMAPKHPELLITEEYISPTYPKPIRYNTDPIRPTTEGMIPTLTYRRQQAAVGIGEFENKPIDNFKDKLILDKYEAQRSKMPLKEGSFDYYEDEIKGLPVRKKRNINRINRKIAPRALHQKLQPINENVLDKRKESITKSVLVSRLQNAQEMESSKGRAENINSTDSIIEIIRSMFS